MSGGGEIIIRNGTFWNWLNYEIVFGGTPDGEYKIAGGKRIKGWHVVGGLVLLAVAGRLA